MIAMQYSFCLPADYDMGIIRRRIAEKGHFLDNFPNMLFKAYLHAERGEHWESAENLYAPFYVWQNSTGLSDFLGSAGFAGLTQSFGWPSVKSWMVWQAKTSPRIREAVFATREILATVPHSSLDDLRRHGDADVLEDVETRGALASVSGFEPTTWSRVRFRLWAEPVAVPAGAQAYTVGHMSVPGAV